MERAQRVTQWARGVFWGNFLGPRHVERLTAAGRLLGEAPCYRVENLGGHGVYLQATSSLWDLQLADLEPLEKFLAPILPTRNDLGYMPLPGYPTLSAEQRAELLELGGMTNPLSGSMVLERIQELAPGVFPPPPPPVPRRQVAAFTPSFPTEHAGRHILGDDEDVMFALWLDREPSSADLQAVRDVVGAWNAEAVGGAFGGQGFSYIWPVEIDEGAVTWRVAWADTELDAYYDLLHRIEGLSQDLGARVARLQVGLSRA